MTGPMSLGRAGVGGAGLRCPPPKHPLGRLTRFWYRSMSMRALIRRLVWVVVLGLLVPRPTGSARAAASSPPPAPALPPPSSPSPPPPSGRATTSPRDLASAAGGHARWWRTAAIAGGLAGVMLLDQPLRDVYRRARGDATDTAARIARPFGGPWTYVSVGTGLLAVGAVGGDDRTAQAGARVGASLLLTGVLTRAGKYMAGRERPAGGRGSHFFEPLSNQTSLPSGHSAMAFALATSLADEVDRPWATALLYTAATATAWSRLNDDIHWTSDVVAGALLGRQCAKFVGQRLRFRGPPPPLLLPYEDGLAVAWTVGL